MKKVKIVTYWNGNGFSVLDFETEKSVEEIITNNNNFCKKMKEIEEWTENCCICNKSIKYKEYSGRIKDKRYCYECDKKTFIARDGASGKSYGFFAGGESQDVKEDNISRTANHDIHKTDIIILREATDSGDLSISYREKEGKEKRLLELQKNYTNNK